ncbi:hypothetical protein [uncultured Fibrobacter sp.]|uniref:hypothetical protein n=1 Tax=uncultured Fibrobacter sp. TaxID=261512 RepID=UPI0025F9016C|nr:hypothetical protein [uncultured Fibrobacter sp.]
MKYLYLLAPILAFFAIIAVYFLIQTNRRPIPHYEPKEFVFDAEEYLRQLKMQHKPLDSSGVHRLLLKRTRQKVGVYLESLEPVMDSIGLEIVNVYHSVMGFDYVPVITSGNDWPYHARKSKHYENKAIDFRIKFLLNEEKKSIVDLATKKLEGRARVIWEKGPMEHLHVELLER